MTKDILTVKELAEYLRIGLTSAYELVHSEGFPTLTIGKKILVPVDELKSWISKHTNQVNN